MLVALTGCSGFIGSYTASALKREGHTVRGLVRKTSRREHIDKVVDQFIVGDQNDDAVLNQLVKGVDAVIHNSVNWQTRSDPIANFNSNLLGSLKLLELTRIAGVKQFVFVSSVAAISEISDQWNGLIDETHPTWPGSLYGAYKAAMEAHIKAYHHAFKMNTSAWRPAAVYGVAPEVERSQWIGIVHDVLDNQPIDMPKGGKITHVQDVADALALSIGDESVAGQIYTIVDRYIYWQEVAQIAKTLTGSTSTITDRIGSGPKNQFDCSKAIAFFDAHHHTQALRRGIEGVRQYVVALLDAMK